MTRYSPTEIDAVKARHPVAALAGAYVALRPGSSKFGRGGFTGPCPLCCADGHDRRKACFECDDEKWVCAKCSSGGDAIALYAGIKGLDAKRDFVAIIDALAGQAAPAQDDTPAVAEREGRRAFARDPALGDRAAPPERYRDRPDLIAAWRRGVAKARAAARNNDIYRERERRRLYREFWRPAAPWPGTPVEDYLCLRGLEAPPQARLRFVADMPYYASGAQPRLIHRGPAMLAAIETPHEAGKRFSGLHITWLDLSQPKGKAALVDPDSGEILPAKKVRGHKAGGFIDLGCGGVTRRLIAGEGIETTLAVYTALKRAGRLRAGDGFRAGIDLGNLAGRAVATVRHPTLKDAAARARRVPGPEPDTTSPVMPVPDSVDALILLGDGDSDPFTTQCAMARAAARHARAGRTVRVIWPPAGKDFNDWMTE